MGRLDGCYFVVCSFDCFRKEMPAYIVLILDQILSSYKNTYIIKKIT